MRLHLYSRYFSMTLLLTLTLGFVFVNGTHPQITAAAPGTTPILVVINSADDSAVGKPYDSYLGEMLRAEGWNSYDTVELSTIASTGSLSGYKLVILAETALTSAQATTFTSFVNGGGRLLAMRPDTQLAPVFGMTYAGSAQTDGYLNINTSVTTGTGLPGSANAGTSGAKPMQIHGTSDRYTATTATKVALLFSNATTATTNPAVVTNTYGTGKAAAFTYDLARNIVMTRQGNPANGSAINSISGVMGDTDGDGVPRTVDLFQSASGGAPWVDLNNVPTPQADEQMRLMSHLVEDLTKDLTPLPRLWYFPQNTPGTDAAMTMLIPTGDAHANRISDYDLELNSIKAHNGSLTIYLSKGGPLETDVDSDAYVENWRDQGFDFGIHPYWNKADGTPPISSLSQGYDVYSGSDGNGGWFGNTFPSHPKSRTVRNHQVAWLGWTDAAEIEAAHGIGLDANFYAWGAWLKKSDGSWAHGYINGSGQPMKFAKNDGSLINLYQQGTQLIDEQLFRAISTSDPGTGVPYCQTGNATEGFECLDAADKPGPPIVPGAITISKQLIDASFTSNYAALMTQFHIDYYNYGDPQTWAEAIMDYANSKNIPIWNAEDWLNYTEMRHDATFTNQTWSAVSGQLGFDITSTTATSDKLTVMVPLTAVGVGNLRAITVNGVATPFTVKTIKGRNYGFTLVAPGVAHVVATYNITVSNASTLEDTKTTSGLIITPSTSSPATTYFRITSITGGTLYKNNGTTAINNNDFITAAEGIAGLKFLPATNSLTDGSFKIQSSTSSSTGGLITDTATAIISISAVNDAPEFTLIGPPVTVNEDSGQHSVAVATNVRPGPISAIDEVGQATSFSIVGNTNPALFSAQPSIDSTGNLTFTPAPDANGTANISLVLHDDGGTMNGGVDTSAPQIFTIVVNPINDAPSFTAGPNKTVRFNAGAQSFAGWATNLRPGPAAATDEMGQALSFNVSVQNVTGDLNFATAPAIDASGTLTFAAADGTSGIATIQISLSDDGGTANGGVDTNAVQTATITVNPPGTLSGTAFYDRNQNGVLDTGETGLIGATITLKDSTGATVKSTTSSTDGTYSIANVLPGNYTLVSAPPSGYGTSASLAITVPVEGLDNQNFAFTTGSIRGSVYVDANSNGARDTGEAGIAGVQITLTGTDANGAAVSKTATTAADGSYGFDELLAGNYTLTEVQPAAYQDGKDSAGTAGGTVGNDTVTGIALGGGVNAVGYVFGELTPSEPDTHSFVYLPLTTSATRP